MRLLPCRPRTAKLDEGEHAAGREGEPLALGVFGLVVVRSLPQLGLLMPILNH